MVLKRLKEFIDANNLSIAAFEKSIGMSNASFGKSLKNNGAIGSDKLENILSVYPDINPDWLLTGRGSMLKSEGKSPMGGLNDRVANTDPNSPSEWIDAGDWFPEATAAIRHYGDSMVEYSSGSILALRRVNDQRLIMNGRNYVIETSEYRVTKQLQDDGDHFMAYSTNRETYPDGRQIHAPFSIPKDAIRYIYLVLGCVTKEYSNGAIQIRK